MNEIFTQPHLPKLKMKLVVDPEEGEVEHPDNAAVGDQEDHEPVEYEEPAAQQEVRQNMDLNQILTSVGLEEYYEQFETELITIKTLKTTTALELREILKNTSILCLNMLSK